MRGVVRDLMPAIHFCPTSSQRPPKEGTVAGHQIALWRNDWVLSAVQGSGRGEITTRTHGSDICGTGPRNSLWRAGLGSPDAPAAPAPTSQIPSLDSIRTRCWQPASAPCHIVSLPLARSHLSNSRTSSIFLPRDHLSRTATFGTAPDAQSQTFSFRLSVRLSRAPLPSPPQRREPASLAYRPPQLPSRPLVHVQLHVPRHRLDVFPVLRDQPLQRRVLALGRPPRHWPSTRL